MDAKWREKFREAHDYIETFDDKAYATSISFNNLSSGFEQSACPIDFTQHEGAREIIDEYVGKADYLAFVAALVFSK